MPLPRIPNVMFQVDGSVVPSFPTKYHYDNNVNNDYIYVTAEGSDARKARRAKCANQFIRTDGTKAGVSMDINKDSANRMGLGGPAAIVF